MGREIERDLMISPLVMKDWHCKYITTVNTGTCKEVDTLHVHVSMII